MSKKLNLNDSINCKSFVSRAMKMQVSYAGVSFWRRHICIQPIPNNECTINRTKTNRLRLATHLFAHVRARSLVLVTIGWICINFSIKIIQVYERFEERCMVSARFELDTLNSSDMQKYIYIHAQRPTCTKQNVRYNDNFTQQRLAHKLDEIKYDQRQSEFTLTGFLV